MASEVAGTDITIEVISSICRSCKPGAGMSWEYIGIMENKMESATL